ncbi:Rna recognition motif-containing protein [Cardiosporidium cionae]|uniref:Rna recognition motif-containing protein n=1 Tax=Cardiosporidium cionae TaxID=476202 RepID=A0ABQ7J7R0_9APIC|nr:Rna recognition motif-containing protein [Cardiosporidium cionae]|eukprot:KAF8820022.1 Rna recognition motif-containing protein [Cardiosporidium cionae]
MSGRGQRRSMSLLVRNLKFQTSPDRVREVFEKFGSIRDVYLPLDFHNRRPRGFGFVEFYDERDAEAALREMDNYEVDGNRIEVTMAQRGRSEPDQMVN